MISAQAQHMAEVWNHPQVQPWVSLGSPELLTAENAQSLLDMGSVYFSNEHGGFVAVPSDGNVYEVHTQFRPEGRGPSLRAFAADFLRHMFVKTPCIALRTFVPDGNVAAYKLAREFGFVEISQTIMLGKRGRTLLLTIKTWVVESCR